MLGFCLCLAGFLVASALGCRDHGLASGFVDAGAGGAGDGGAGVAGGGEPGGGGAGGASAAGDKTCAELDEEYHDALPSAQACDVGGVGQCQTQVILSLSCGCRTFVNDSTVLDAMYARWKAAGCTPAQMNCPTGCPGPSATCRGNDAGAGTCVSS